MSAPIRSDHRTFGLSGMNLRAHSERRPAEAPARRVHEFPADIVRAGGQTTKVTYKLQCARCQRASVYEAVSIKSDARVAAKFEQRGWLLGKSRNADICPACLSGDPDAKLADNQSTNNPAEMVLSPGQLAEQLFMPMKKGESSPVVVVEGTRRMSRARQQAEASASSVFTKGPIASNRPTLSLGGTKSETRAAADAVFKSPAPKTTQPAQPSEAVGRSFDSGRSDADSSLRKDMSVLASALTSMAEQIGLMAQVQAASIAENRDKVDLHALLAKQTEMLARLAPVVAGSQNLPADGPSEIAAQPLDLVSAPPEAVPASVNDAQANAIGEAPKVAEPAEANAETSAQATTESAVVPAAAPETAAPRVLPSLISSMPQAPALSETGKPSKAARTKPRANAKAKAPTVKVARAAARKPAAKPAEAASPVVLNEASTGGAAVKQASSGKRFRRTKAQMDEFRREQQTLEALGLKRGRGRPSKQALSAEQIAAIAASPDPEAARAEILAQMQRQAQVEARAKVKAKKRAKAEAKKAKAAAEEAARAEAEASASANETAAAEQTSAAPEAVADAAPAAPKRGRKSKSAVSAIDEVAAVVEVPKRGGRKAKAPAVEALPTEAAPAKKAAARKAAKDQAVEAPSTEVAPVQKAAAKKAAKAVEVAPPAEPVPPPQPQAAPAPKPRGRPRKDASVVAAAGTPVAAPVAVSEPAPKRRGRKPKAVAAAEAPAAAEVVAAPAAKPRGKTKKDATVAASANVAQTAAADVSTPAKRPRGRPRKDATAPVSTAAAPKKERKASAATKAPAAKERISAINWAKAKLTPDVMVLSSGKFTTMQIGRKIWEAAGFTDDESVFVLSDGQEIRITKQAGGRKPTSSRGSVITLKVPSIGEASLWKIKYAIEGDALFLHGQLAS